MNLDLKCKNCMKYNNDMQIQLKDLQSDILFLLDMTFLHQIHYIDQITIVITLFLYKYVCLSSTKIQKKWWFWCIEQNEAMYLIIEKAKLSLTKTCL